MLFIRTFKEWNAKRKLKNYLASQPKPDMAMRANPITINPTKEQKLLRACCRLKRLLYAIEQGDTRKSLLEEIENKLSPRLVAAGLEVPLSGAEAELLVYQIKTSNEVVK